MTGYILGNFLLNLTAMVKTLTTAKEMCPCHFVKILLEASKN